MCPLAKIVSESIVSSHAVQTLCFEPASVQLASLSIIHSPTTCMALAIALVSVTPQEQLLSANPSSLQDSDFTVFHSLNECVWGASVVSSSFVVSGVSVVSGAPVVSGDAVVSVSGTTVVTEDVVFSGPSVVSLPKDEEQADITRIAVTIKTINMVLINILFMLYSS